jgi:hypothetical protein
VSDVTIAFVLAMVCLVAFVASIVANVIRGVPQWLGGPVAAVLLFFGLANLAVSAKEEGS